MNVIGISKKHFKEIEMGTFHVGCQIENHQNNSKFIKINKLLVDTGAEHTWIRETKLSRIGITPITPITPIKKDAPFRMANGQLITRNIGFMIIRINKSFTIDGVVFAQKGDSELLGARSLEGLNLSVDSKRKKLVAAGPYPVAMGAMDVVG